MVAVAVVDRQMLEVVFEYFAGVVAYSIWPLGYWNLVQEVGSDIQGEQRQHENQWRFEAWTLK